MPQFGHRRRPSVRPSACVHGGRLPSCQKGKEATNLPPRHAPRHATVANQSKEYRYTCASPPSPRAQSGRKISSSTHLFFFLRRRRGGSHCVRWVVAIDRPVICASIARDCLMSFLELPCHSQMARVSVSQSVGRTDCSLATWHAIQWGAAPAPQPLCSTVQNKQKIPWCLECLGKRDLIPFCMLTAATRAKGGRKRRHCRKRTAGGTRRGHTYMQLQKNISFIEMLSNPCRNNMRFSGVAPQQRTYFWSSSLYVHNRGRTSSRWMDGGNELDWFHTRTHGKLEGVH